MKPSKIKKKLYTAILGSYRSIAYVVSERYKRTMPLPSKEEAIDVVIPVIEKDLDTLPLCIEGIRRCIRNNVDKIYIISPKIETIIRVAEQYKLHFIDENSVLGYSPRDFKVITRSGKNRSGWIFQQLLKLSGKIGNNRFFIVIDSDHILINPHTFISEEGKHVFYQSKEYYYPYYENIKRLTGEYPYQHLSYIAHKMVFDKEKLTHLRNTIKQKNTALGDSWDKIIINSLNTNYDSSFSEFELYGHFIPASEKIRLPWKQKELQKGDKLPNYEELVKEYANQYLSVTFPDYRKETKVD